MVCGGRVGIDSQGRENDSTRRNDKERARKR